MQARYYDPVIGRFYSNDPVDAVAHLGGDTGIQGVTEQAMNGTGVNISVTGKGQYLKGSEDVSRMFVLLLRIFLPTKLLTKHIRNLKG